MTDDRYKIFLSKMFNRIDKNKDSKINLESLTEFCLQIYHEKKLF